MNIILSTFTDLQRPSGKKTVTQIHKATKSGVFKDKIEQFRELLQAGRNDEADKIKKELPSFTPAGVFTASRDEEHLQDYSQVICLEYDGLTQEDLERTYKQVVATPYTYMAFVSPDENGIKALVRVDSTQQEHQSAFQQVKAYYEEVSGCAIGLEGDSLTCLCPVSFDPNAYLNENAEVFQVSAYGTQVTFFKKVYEQLKKLMYQKSQNWPEENKEHFHSLVCQCNNYGIPEEVVLNLLETAPVSLSTLLIPDMCSEVRTVYQTKRSEFAKLAELARLATSSKNISGGTDGMEQTPNVPNEVYDQLPNLLNKSCQLPRNTREKDIALIGTLGLLSGCFPHVTGLYRNKSTASNLYIFITAPAACGKGILEDLRNLTSPIHQKIKEISEIEQKQYKQNESAARRSGQPIPERPPMRMFIIPANTSSAMVMNILKGNSGQGIIFETEADTLQKTFKQDWGDFSDNLRKGFHHETMSSCRKFDFDCIEVDNPKISVVLSGTPRQVTNLFGSAENGLFSRFIFYSFDSGAHWESVATQRSKHVDTSQYYRTLGNTVQKLHDLFAVTNIQFELPEEFCDVIDLYFSMRLEEASTFNEGAESVVKRLGQITFRIAMLLTTVRIGERCLETGEILPETMICNLDDFNTAMQLTSTFYNHAMPVFRALPKQNSSNVKLGTDKQTYFNNLPYRFKREEAIGAGKGVGLTPDSVDKLLRKLTKNGLLNKADYGYYQKVTNG